MLDDELGDLSSGFVEDKTKVILSISFVYQKSNMRNEETLLTLESKL